MTATVPIGDRGFTLGVGLFETVLTVDGQMQLWDAHVSRLRRGCAILGLPVPDAALLISAASAAIEASGQGAGRAAVRLTWTGGSGTRGLTAPAAVEPRLFATAAPAALPPSTMSLATSPIRRNSTSPTSRMKTLSYLDNVEARRLAVSAGADEALLLNERGELASCAAANIFWVADGQLLTSPLTAGVLDGVARGEALEAAGALGWRCSEVAAPPRCLAEAQGVFITNSLLGAVAITSLDGTALAHLDTRGRALVTSIQARVTASGS